MHNLVGTCAALGLIVGGFMLTGDLGWLATRGLRVIEATDVPDDEAPVPMDTSAEKAAPAARTGVGRPPRTDLVAVDIASLEAGNRLRVWVRRPGQPATGDCACVALDLIDPAASEALASVVPRPPAPGEPAVAPSPPRRVFIRGSGSSGVVAVGDALALEPHGIATDAGPENLGAVVAMDVVR